MQIESKEWMERKKGVTGRIFLCFVAASILALLYFNITPRADLVALAQKFPEVGDTMQKTFVRSFKMAISMALFLVDIILVGPFAYISYFGDHIKPRKGSVLNKVSFFDFGLLLALWFTLTLAGIHFQLLNYVRKVDAAFLTPSAFVLFSGAAFLIWIMALLMKFYSYTSYQRKELKKYAIRF